MKALRREELENFVRLHQDLLGARLQEILVSDRDLGLGLFGHSRMQYLWFDLNPVKPMLAALPQPPPFFKAKASQPVALFLKAHARGHRLKSMNLDEEYGRVLHLTFEGPSKEEACRIEARLFPHGQNVIVSKSGKHISWSKPKTLELLSETVLPIDADPPTIRTEAEWTQEWFQFRRPSKPPPAQNPNKQNQKKEQVLGKLRTQLAEWPEESPWRKWGEQLKAGGALKEIPEPYGAKLDPSKDLHWNIRFCFDQAKLDEKKRRGLEERVQTLEKNVAEPVETRASSNAERAAAPRSTTEVKKERGFFQGPYWVSLGKSGVENLKLLREARPWDLWLHLKDYPGAFGILHRQRRDTVSSKDLEEAAAKLARFSFGRKSDQHQGERLDIVVAECRYVSPIRGDRLGRVQYRESQVLRILLD